MEKEYAVYKGENILAVGTIQECAEQLSVKPQTILFYRSNAYQNRTSEKA